MLKQLTGAQRQTKCKMINNIRLYKNTVSTLVEHSSTQLINTEHRKVSLNTYIYCIYRYIQEGRFALERTKPLFSSVFGPLQQHLVFVCTDQIRPLATACSTGLLQDRYTLFFIVPAVQYVLFNSQRSQVLAISHCGIHAALKSEGFKFDPTIRTD